MTDNNKVVNDADEKLKNTKVLCALHKINVI